MEYGGVKFEVLVFMLMNVCGRGWDVSKVPEGSMFLLCGLRRTWCGIEEI